MYIPEYNRVEDNAVTLSFLQSNPFAILTSSTEADPFASHIPVLARYVEGQFHVRGHLAKANPHCKLLEQGRESLVIFHGPHAYISPRHYANRESVPTWNYAAVHVYGGTTAITDPAQLNQLLLEIIAQFDSTYAEQWSSLSNQYRSRMLHHIVGFELVATRVETKFKLSQNRTRTEQENVIRALAGSSDSNERAVAAVMKERGLGSR